MHLYRGISQLITLKGIAANDGRHPVEKDLSIVKNAAFAVRGGRLEWVGKASQVPSRLIKNIKKEIDLHGKTVLPGFVECHTHSIFAGDRAHEFELRHQGISYAEINRRGGGIMSTVRKTRKTSAEALLGLAQKRTDHFVEQGVTCLEIKSGYGLNRSTEEKMLRVAKEINGPRIVATYLGPHSLPDKKKSSSDVIDRIVKLDLRRVVEKQLASRADIFIEKGFFDSSDGRRYLQKALALGLDITIHADQIHRTGATKLAVELGAKSADHVIEASSADLKALARSKTVAVLLPAADFYLQMKYPKARQIIDQGGRVALATDFNPGSSPTQDLSFVGLLARMEMKMSLPETLAAYTYNAACALGLERELGSLEAGKNADFIVLDGEWRELFYHVGQPGVESVWRSGKRIYRARQKS